MLEGESLSHTNILIGVMRTVYVRLDTAIHNQYVNVDRKMVNSNLHYRYEVS